MKKTLYIAALALAVVLPAAAQDTYESARLLGNDLNGTARYVGMGGAMEALGADISTISTNPAGIGLFRHSTISASAGLVAQQGAHEFDGKNGTKMSFDQLGIVYSSRVSRRSFVNVAFNYHKNRNFNQILSAANSLRNASQNGLTYYKHRLRSNGYGGFWSDYNTAEEPVVVGWKDKDSELRSQTFSQSDFNNINVLMSDYSLYKELYDDIYNNPDMVDDWVFYNDADEYKFERSQRGWINEYDFCVSGNQGDRFFWGVTVGIHDVNYKGYSLYSEGLIGHDDNDNVYDAGIVDYSDDRRIEGTGIDVKAGIIFRPIEESPFRIGLSVSTPTWYELNTINDTWINNDAHDKDGNPIGNYYEYEYEFGTGESYDFRYYTSWKFGASLGHTIGNNLALGVSYEISDYSTADNRIVYDEANSYGYERSYSDGVMKYNTENSLKAVHLLKAGIEYKPNPALALRFGYNYVSSTYEKNGVRDMTLDSPGVAYSSTTDYVNWKDTHRITCGVGYKVNGWNFDLAYQYNTTNGDFYPMQQFESGQSVGMTKVDFKRHQVLLTLGYTF